MDEQPGSRWFDRSWVMWVVLVVLAVVSSATAIGVTRWVTADRSVVASPSSSVAPSVAPSSSVPSPTPSPSLTDEQQIIAQYERFQADTYTARLGPADARREVMSATSADPLLTRIIDNMAAQEADGVTIWGEPDIVLDSTVEVSGDRATLTVCLDSSNGGQAEALTGEKITVGPPRNPGIAALIRQVDGIWRLTSNNYPGGDC